MAYPKHLFRLSDNERFTHKGQGIYTLDSSRMAKPYEWSYIYMIGTGAFSTKPRVTR